MADPAVICLPEPKGPWLGAPLESDKTASRSSGEVSLPFKRASIYNHRANE